jgi:hypothetical protein
MKLKRVIGSLGSAIAVMLVAGASSMASDSVELNLENTLQLDTAAVDVASSADGDRFFILTDQGQILVYSSKGEKQGQLDVGPDVDQLRVTPKGDTLLLNSRKNKTLQVVSLEFIRQIDISGSPAKGPADAPVVIAVYTDFQ